MKKTLVILAVFVTFFSVKLYAQSTEDVVYLNNGSILRGKVIETVSGRHTTIEIAGRNVLFIPDSALKLVLMDQPLPARDRENNASAVEMAASVSFFGGSKNSAGSSFITSYRFPFRLSTGVGIGDEWFDHQQIPFIADVKYSFLKGSWSPYIYAQTGYAIPMSKNSDNDNSWYYQNTDYYGGVLAGAGGGMRFDFSGHNALIFSIGYRYQKTKTVTTDPWSSYQSETIVYDEYNRMTFAVGFLFN
jgi:hypothetical protein